MDQKINKEDVKKFTWANTEDSEVWEKGMTIMWAAGRTAAIQKFVETLSYKVGAKADFSFQGGRAHIEIMPEGIEAARKLINDEEFMKQFCVPYSDESYANGTYFERLL